MKRFIFLDFDGVMDTTHHTNWLYHEGLPENDRYGVLYDPECVGYLREIVDRTDAEICDGAHRKGDSLKAKGLPDHKIVVTSILRTKADVDKLQKSNSIAVTNSCRCYGTTFDISYTQFERVALGKSMAQEDLKKVLGEVLKDQRKAGAIYVKHEVSQPCFHITSRK